MIKPSFHNSLSIKVKALLLLILLLISVFPFTGCAVRREPAAKTGFYFDTAITVTVYDPPAPGLPERCFELADRYEGMFSRTVEGSDVWKINHAGGAPVTVSADTALLVQTALSFAELTDGALDPTVGRVSSLWNFSGADGEDVRRPPDESALKEALSHVNYRNIHVNGNTVTLTDPLAELDLGFIAKGFIADRMKELLLSEGVKSALINLGGNVLTLGARPDGSPFRIGIQKPFSPEGTSAAVLSAEDLSVVSSGTYERYFEYDGELYHHILDTKTGRPIRNSLSSVTILSSSSVDGDGLSTACFVLGLERGMELIESLEGIEAVFITDDGVLHATGGVSLSE